MARPSNDYPAVYPDTTNKTKLTSTVRVTLNTTLTKSQNSHPLPMSSKRLPCGKSRPRSHLHLEHYLFQDRFQVAHSLRSSFRTLLLQRIRQPRKADLVVLIQ